MTANVEAAVKNFDWPIINVVNGLSGIMIANTKPKLGSVHRKFMTHSAFVQYLNAPIIYLCFLYFCFERLERTLTYDERQQNITGKILHVFMMC